MEKKLSGKKLPKRFKEKWIKALRSGKYLQTDGELYSSSANDFKGGYCCLGVAGVICSIDNDTLDGKGCLSIYESGLDEGTLKVIPILIRGSAAEGYDDNNPIVEKLSKFNDEGKSFKWIAAYIDRYL